MQLTFKGVRQKHFIFIKAIGIVEFYIVSTVLHQRDTVLIACIMSKYVVLYCTLDIFFLKKGVRTSNSQSKLRTESTGGSQLCTDAFCPLQLG